MNINKLNEALAGCDKLKVLCGAGISLNSGMPLANQYLKYIFTHSGYTDKYAQEIINYHLPFETWLKLYIDYNDYLNNHYYLLDVFSASEVLPNKNHFLIADLVLKGVINDVYTTNFDLLLEKAFEDRGLKRSVDYEVFYNEQDFENVNACKLPRIIKLHGSAEDYNSIRITIDKVSSRTNVNYRKNVIEAMVSKNEDEKLLILGYSCSDIFDIVPAIENSKTPHCAIINLRHDKVEEIYPLPVKWPKDKSCTFTGLEIKMPTDKFIDFLYQFYQLDNSFDSVNQITGSYLLEKYVSPLFDSFVYSSNKHLILAEIKRMIGEFSQSNDIVQQVLSGDASIEEISMRKSQEYLYAKNEFGDSNIHQALLDFDRSVITRLSENAAFCDNLKCIEMATHFNANNYKSFFDVFSHLLDENKRYLVQNYVGICGIIFDNSIGILGAILGKCSCLIELSNDVSVEYILNCVENLVDQHKSLDIGSELSLVLLNTQGIFYNKKRQYSKSYCLLEKACELADHVGDVHRLGVILVNLVSTYFYLNNLTGITTAVNKYFHKAINANQPFVVKDLFTTLYSISASIDDDYVKWEIQKHLSPIIQSVREYMDSDVKSIIYQLQMWSNNPEKHFTNILNETEAAIDKAKKAANIFLAAKEIRSLFCMLYSFKAAALNELCRFAEAIDENNKIIDFLPDNPEAWYSKGKCYEQFENYEESLRCLNHALAFQTDQTRRYDILEAIDYVKSQMAATEQ